MGRTRRPPATIAAVVAFTVVLAACGTHPGGAAGGSLHDGLSAVADSPTSRAALAWADQTELRKLSGIASYNAVGGKKVDPRWARLTVVALPTVAGLEPQLTAAIGLDVYKGTRAMTVGSALAAAGRVDGADTSAVQARLKAMGAQTTTSNGTSLTVLASDDQVDVGNPHLSGDVYLALNRVAIKGSTVAFALASAPLNVVLGGGRSLADNADDAAIADCLGDVMVARITAPPAGAAAGVSLVGVGVRRPTDPGGPVQEVLCEAVGGSLVTTVTAAMVQRTHPDAILPVGGEQVRDRITQATVDQVQKNGVHTARLVVQLVTPARAGFLLLDQGTGDAGLAYLGGGLPPPGGGS